MDKIKCHLFFREHQVLKASYIYSYIIQEMSEAESDDSKHHVSVSESGEGQDISPELAVLIATIVAFVLLVIIMVTLYWLKKIRGEKSQIDFQSDYDNSFQDIVNNAHSQRI